jgi:tetratricopeptide (TPR) repeat protein
MNLEKLKDTARKFEQKEDWRKAIEVYLKAIQQIESGSETSPDLSLYNRVGDLYLRINDTSSAVRSYERAVDLYADQGFFNNAIALCGKILRVNPGRTQTYLKLAQLHARKNVVIEAKRNLIEFLERMNALGQLDPAFQSVKEFADQFSGSQEIRIMLVELLRAASREDEAREQLEKLAGELESRGAERAGGRRASEGEPAGDAGEMPAQQPQRSAGRPGGLVFLDTGIDLPAASPPGEEAAEPVTSPPEGLMVSEPLAGEIEQPGELIIDPLEPAAIETTEPVAGLEQVEEELDLAPVDGLESAPLHLERDDEPTELDFDEPALGGIEENTLLGVEAEELAAPEEDLRLVDEGVPELVEESLPGELEEEASELLEESASEGLPPEAPMAGLPIIPVEGAGTASIAELENRILDDPDNPVLHENLADRLISDGDEIRALEELELALAGYEAGQDWSRASATANLLVTVAPEVIRYHQKRVELAYRQGDRAPLLEAYLTLADSLALAGATDKAVAVYSRVQEHDPGNARAEAAVRKLQGGGAPEPRPVSPPVSAPPVVSTPPVPPPPVAPQPAAFTPPAPEPVNGSFVDFGSLVLDEAGPRDTRMRVSRREPQDEDEQREFQDILEQFKRGIDQNLDTEDYQAHYDLGIAFKEMGLLDEAVEQFQKALRSSEGRLRTSEALGLCFFEKSQFAIAESVLRRAVDTLEGGDDAKIGLLYWLGRAAEAQGKDREAISSYERAMAVDIRFMDLGQRISRLTAGRRE